MSEQYVFTPGTDSGFIPLSRTKTGRLVKKEILRTGKLNYPGIRGGSVQLTGDMFDKIVENFNSKVCDIVQFPLADASNSHSEDPLRNGGEVVQLERKGDSLYAYIDVRKPEVVDGIVNKTILGASAMLALNYTDTRTGKPAGPTLLHVAGTNRPHVLELDDFEVIAASVDSKGEAVLLTAPTDNKETTSMTTKDEAIAYLRSEHDIDVDALMSQSEANANVAELSAKLTEALDSTGIIKLSSGETASAEDLVLAVSQLAEDKVELSNRIETLELSSRQAAAQAEVDKLISEGFVPEAKRDAYVELRLSNEETFKALIPEQPILRLSGETQSIVQLDQTPNETVEAEIARLSAL